MTEAEFRCRQVAFLKLLVGKEILQAAFMFIGIDDGAVFAEFTDLFGIII